MSKIAAGIVAFADALGLARTLETLTPHTDLNIVVHAQYQGFHDKAASESLEETRAVCEAFPNTRVIDLNPCTEIEARQAYLNEATNCDYLLVIDSDEYLVQKAWGLFAQNAKKCIDDPYYIYDIQFSGPAYISGPKPRLFKHPSKIKYYLKHYWWILPNGRLMKGNSDSAKTIEGITMTGDDQLREPERAVEKAKYQQWLLTHESQFVV